MKPPLRRYYANAPITEALVGIQIPPILDLDFARLAELNERHEPRFPNRRDMVVGELKFDLSGESETQASRAQNGYAFVSEDETTVAQLRNDGLFVSHLSPYRGWEALRDDLLAWWALYHEAIGAEYATRLALRYINKLILPGGEIDFQDYLRTYPEISSDMNQNVTGYFFQFTSPQPEVGGTLILNQAILPEPGFDGLPVLLDIDLFVTGEYPVNGETLWEVLESLHDQKNKIFEACITERTRELIG